jgi:hypothetical protein
LINQLWRRTQNWDRSKLNWGISYNIIEGSMPDRFKTYLEKRLMVSIIKYLSTRQPYISKTKEDELAANASYDYKFNKTEDGDFLGKVTFGLNERIKSRGFQTQFNIKATSGNTNTIVDPNNLDLFYNQTNFDLVILQSQRSVETLKYLMLFPQTYGGFNDSLHLPIQSTSSKNLVVLGLRGEAITQKVAWNTQLGAIGTKQNSFHKFSDEI